MLIGGIPTQPFSMAGLPPLGNPNSELGDALKQLSAAKYGRPKAVIEKEIFERISTPAANPDEANKPNFGRNFNAQSPAAAQRPQRPSSGSSFLDDWLQKKETNAFRAPSSPFNSQNQPQQRPQQPAQTPQQAAPAPQPTQTTLNPSVSGTTQPGVSQQVTVPPQQPAPVPQPQDTIQPTQAQPQDTKATNDNTSPIPKQDTQGNTHVPIDESHDHTVDLR